MAETLPVKPYSSERTFSSVQISTASDGLSDIAHLGGHALSSIEMSTAWTAAAMTLQASLDGTNFQNVYDELGNEVTLTTTASRVIQLDPARYASFHSMKLRSGLGSTSVPQAATRTLRLGLVPV